MIDPYEIKLVELATGAEGTLLRGDDLSDPVGLTPDDAYLVVPTNLAKGEVTLVPVAGGTPTVIAFGEPLLVVAAGASRTG